MTEDDLLSAITEAMTLLGWRWSHTRRSDRAQIMGHPGVPDILAARGQRLLLIELKSEKGQLTQDQFAWQLALPESCRRVWRPSDLDRALEELR